MSSDFEFIRNIFNLDCSLMVLDYSESIYLIIFNLLMEVEKNATLWSKQWKELNYCREENSLMWIEYLCEIHIHICLCVWCVCDGVWNVEIYERIEQENISEIVFDLFSSRSMRAYNLKRWTLFKAWLLDCWYLFLSIRRSQRCTLSDWFLVFNTNEMDESMRCMTGKHSNVNHS